MTEDSLWLGLSAAVAVLWLACAHAPSPPLGDAPAAASTGIPLRTISAADAEGLQAAMAPYLARAKETYPDARARFLTGLPKGSYLIVAREIRLSTGAAELQLLEVDSITNQVLHGREYLGRAQAQGLGAELTFPESEVIDWMIENPDGSEEGWFHGKFLYDWNTGHDSLK